MTVTYGYDKRKITASRATLNAIGCDMATIAGMYAEQGNVSMRDIYNKRFSDIYDALDAVGYYEEAKKHEKLDCIGNY